MRLGPALLTLVIALLVTQARSSGIPVIDAAGLTQMIMDFQQKVRDYTQQTAKLAASQETIAQNTSMISEWTSITIELKRSPDVVSAVQDSVAYRSNPGTKDTSNAATQLFGVPRESLEKKIIKVVLEFADRPGVRKAGLDTFGWRTMFQALIKQESAFNPTATSHVGAYGLTQIMPGTASDLGIDPQYRVGPNAIMHQLRGGARYITTQLNSFGRVDHALAAYNAGPGNVRKYKGIPPFQETRNYVKVITGQMKRYAAKFGDGNGVQATGLDDEGDMASGQNAGTADAVTIYAEDIAKETEDAKTRIEEVLGKIDSARSIKDSRDLNTLMKAEIVKLNILFSRLRAATSELMASNQVLVARDKTATTDFLDWRIR